VHRMDTPDPGVHLHDHPWFFASLVLKGGYTEERTATRNASIKARGAEWLEAVTGKHELRGQEYKRRPLSFKTFHKNECHRISHLTEGKSWSLIIRGPKTREWGFFMPVGWVEEQEYAVMFPDRVEEVLP
jgi:hypothetical protein